MKKRLFIYEMESSEEGTGKEMDQDRSKSRCLAFSALRIIAIVIIHDAIHFILPFFSFFCVTSDRIDI